MEPDQPVKLCGARSDTRLHGAFVGTIGEETSVYWSSDGVGGNDRLKSRTTDETPSNGGCIPSIFLPKKKVDPSLMVYSSSSSFVSPVILSQDELKKATAYKAAEFVESGMVVGLGTWSTAKHAVDRIAELSHSGKLKNIVGITHEQAVSLGIPLSDLNAHPILDLTVDGADEVDPLMNLVKGRVGSLLGKKWRRQLPRNSL